MSSSPEITEMYTEISTAIRQKNMSELHGALSDRFGNKKAQLTEQDLLDPIYALALSCAAQSEDKKNASRVTRLLMQNIFNKKNKGSIPALLEALRLAVKKEKVAFIDTVLEEFALVQNLLINADQDLLAALVVAKPKLLQQSSENLLALLNEAFKKGNIQFACAILKENPTLLIKHIEETDTLPHLINLEEKVPEAVDKLFEELIEKNNLELISAFLSAQNAPQFHGLAKNSPDKMIVLLEKAIKEDNTNFVRAALKNNPELLLKKIKSAGKKPIVLAAKLQHWTMLVEIANVYAEQSENGDFHMALLWALKASTKESANVVLDLDLNFICTSAETLGNEKNILHYAMFNNNEAIIKKIFSLKDERILLSLIMNRNGKGYTPIAYAAHNKKWAAVFLHAKLYTPKTEQEYNEYYLPVLENAIANGSEEALSAALALTDASINFRFKPEWIAAVANQYLLKKELTDLGCELFARLLQISMDGNNNVEPLINELNIEEKLFISNLLKIQNKIAPGLFKRLISISKNGKTVIESAKEWKDVAALAKTYSPENPNEYVACGYQNRLELAIKTNNNVSLSAASELLSAAKVSGYILDTNSIDAKIKFVIIDQKQDLPLRNTVMSKLLNLCANDQEIVTIISKTVCYSEKNGGTRTRISKYDAGIRVCYELKEKNSKHSKKIKENVKELIDQITIPEIKLRVIMALLFNTNSSIYQSDSDSLFNGTRNILVESSIDILTENKLALEDSFASALLQKITAAIGENVNSWNNFTPLNRLTIALVDQLLKNGISDSLLAKLIEFTNTHLAQPEFIQETCIMLVRHLKERNSDVSIAGYTDLLNTLLVNHKREKLLQLALEIIETGNNIDMTSIVVNMAEVIGKMLNEPNEIKFAIFNRLIEKCALEQRVAIIQKIAQSQSDVTETLEQNMMAPIRAIENPQTRVDIILGILANESRSAEMKLELIEDLLIDLNRLNPQEFKLQILNMITAIGATCISLENDRPNKVKLLILQDFLRVIAGEQSLLTGIDSINPEETQAMIWKLYSEIIVPNKELTQLFLGNLHGVNPNPKSLVYKTIKPSFTKRKLASPPKTEDMPQKTPEKPGKSVTQKTLKMLPGSTSGSAAPSSSSSSSSSFFSRLSSTIDNLSSTASTFVSSTASSLLSSLSGSSTSLGSNTSSHSRTAPLYPEPSAPPLPASPSDSRSTSLSNGSTPTFGQTTQSVGSLSSLSWGSSTSSPSKVQPSAPPAAILEANELAKAQLVSLQSSSPSNVAPAAAMFPSPSSPRGTHSSTSMANLAAAPSVPTESPQQLLANRDQESRKPAPAL